MTTLHTTTFTDLDLKDHLDRCSDEELDGLAFGVIGIDSAGLVRRYNSFESKMAGLSPARVLGNALFTAVAPCMNNFMVAQRFEDALAQHAALDVTLDYVFTLRMRPVKVKLRLLAAADEGLRYVVVYRPA